MNLNINDARDFNGLKTYIHHSTRHLCDNRTLWGIRSKTGDTVCWLGLWLTRARRWLGEWIYTIIYYIEERHPRKNFENGANWRGSCETFDKIKHSSVSSEQTRRKCVSFNSSTDILTWTFMKERLWRISYAAVNVSGSPCGEHLRFW